VGVHVRKSAHGKPLRSRGIAARDFQRARERGRRAAAFHCLERQPFGARGGVLVQVEGAKHMRERAVGPTRALWRGLSSFAGPRAAALIQLDCELGRRSRRAAVRLIAEFAQPRTPAPAI
jgi:hypothetical protein